MIYGRISAHNSQHRDNPSLWVPHLKGACPLRCSARRTQVLAVKFDQVEGTEHGGVVVLLVADQVKDREAVLIDNNRLAIDDAGLHGQALDRFGDPGEAGGEIVSVPREEPHAVTVKISAIRLESSRCHEPGI